MKKESILLVDDDTQVLPGLKKILEERGHNVVAVESGKKALSLLRDKNFSLILTEIDMNEISGLEILKKVKTDSSDISVILMAGYGSINNAIEAVRNEANDIIMKPFTSKELIFRIENAIERRRLRHRAKETEKYQLMSETLGAVAHEINNPLTAVIGNAELLREEIPENSPASDMLEDIIISANRITKTIWQMREVRGIKTKKYTKKSKIIDILKSSECAKPDEKTVLVVDDEESIRKITTRILATSGYEVDAADGGNEALNLIKKKNYAVVILDVNMPDMDGYDTLRKINEYYIINETQIPATIMYTGFDAEEVLKKCKKIGAYTALRKPANLDELLAMVRQAEEFAKQ